MLVAVAAVTWGLIPPLALLAYRDGWTPVSLALYTHLVMLPAAVPLVIRSQRKTSITIYAVLFTAMRLSYLTSVAVNGPSVAAALLYTAPVLVTAVRRRASIEAVVASLGAWLTLGAPLNPTPGVLVGLASGTAYAAMIIYSERVENSLEAAVASQGLAALPLLPLCVLDCKTGPLHYPLLLALLPGVLAYTFFIRGTRLIGAEKSSVIATAEPVTAAIASFLLGEKLTPLQVTGIGMVLAAAVRSAGRSNVVA